MFLDRDGTINAKAPEGAYVTGPGDLRLLPGAATAIRRLNDAAVPVIVVTNQRGIARGLMTESDLAAIHDELEHQLWADGRGRIDAFFYCPHDIGECQCRKPEPGLLFRAARSLRYLRLEHSLLIGDSATDCEAATRAGMPSIQLGLDVPNLPSALDLVTVLPRGPSPTRATTATDPRSIADRCRVG
jgi:D-glycero-D-manno-heptose 1,7-bisphosphate phosphatase